MLQPITTLIISKNRLQSCFSLKALFCALWDVRQNIMKLTLIVIVSFNGVFGIGYRYCTDTGQLYKPTNVLVDHLSDAFNCGKSPESNFKSFNNLQNYLLICAANFYDSYFCISIKTRQIFPISENNQQSVSVRKIPPREVDLKYFKSCNFAQILLSNEGEGRQAVQESRSPEEEARGVE